MRFFDHGLCKNVPFISFIVTTACNAVALALYGALNASL